MAQGSKHSNFTGMLGERNRARYCHVVKDLRRAWWSSRAPTINFFLNRVQVHQLFHNSDHRTQLLMGPQLFTFIPLNFFCGKSKTPRVHCFKATVFNHRTPFSKKSVGPTASVVLCCSVEPYFCGDVHNCIFQEFGDFIRKKVGDMSVQFSGKLLLFLTKIERFQKVNFREG